MIGKALLYLYETLANYVDSDLGREIYQKLKTKNYTNEEAFVNDLDDREMIYLDRILEKEIDYTTKANDTVRTTQLKAIYELLY